VRLRILVLALFVVPFFVSGVLSQEKVQKPAKPEGREEFLRSKFCGVWEANRKGALDLLKDGKLLCGATLLENCYALTCLSALPEDLTVLKLRSSTGATVDAEVVCRHFGHDIALLRLNGELEGAEPLPFGEDKLLKKGQFLFTVASDKERFSVSVLSSVSRNIERISDKAAKRLAFLGILSEDFPLPRRPYIKTLQHDGYVYANMRGLPLIEKTGRLVGVNLGIVWRGVALAVSVSTIKALLPLLKKNKVLALYPYLGFKAKSLEEEKVSEELEEFLRSHRIKDGYGVEVMSVVEGGPAHKAGLRKGDVILMVGVEPTPTKKALEEVYRWLLPSMEIELTVFREGEVKSVRVKVGSRKSRETVLRLKGDVKEEDAKKALEETKKILMAKPLFIEKKGDEFLLHIETPVPKWALKHHLRYAETVLKDAE